MKTLISFVALFFLSNVQAFVPMDAYTFDFNIEVHDMGHEREEKIYQSVELLRTIFSSPEFREKILNHQFKDRKTFYRNNGLTNEEIYKKILAGVEKLDPERNNAMDVEIGLFTDMKSNVLGFTRTSTKKIWMNTKYFNKKTTPVELSSHLMHEWLHKLGFGHERERCENRQYSVPYAIGYIVKELAEEAIQRQEGAHEFFPAPEELQGNVISHWQTQDPERHNLLLKEE